MAFFDSFKKGLKTKSGFETKFEEKARKVGGQVGRYVSKEVGEIRAGLDVRRDRRMRVQSAYQDALQTARINAARKKASFVARQELRRDIARRSRPVSSFDFLNPFPRSQPPQKMDYDIDRERRRRRPQRRRKRRRY